ncbi:MAG: hydroxymethylbilane synthase [Burkholderiales bacterium]
MAVPKTLVIATRESRLARWQAEYIRDRVLELYPQMNISILGITTRGDLILDQPLAKIGGKGLFIKELEVALDDGRAHIAVHSMKDVPMNLPEGFSLSIIGQREDARDAFVSNEYDSLDALPAGAIVGTSSLRREAQIRARYPKLQIQSLRGNVQTRLRKLDEKNYAAIILAAAGLKRLGLAGRIKTLLTFEQSLPAVGQGALGIEIESQLIDYIELFKCFESSATNACVLAERAFSRRLSGSCEVPLGGYAHIIENGIMLTGFVATPDGKQMLRASMRGKRKDAEKIGTKLAEQMLTLGADKILAELESAPR